MLMRAIGTFTNRMLELAFTTRVALAVVDVSGSVISGNHGETHMTTGVSIRTAPLQQETELNLEA